MPLSSDARNRLGIATTDFDVGNEIANAIDASSQKTTSMAFGIAVVLRNDNQVVVVDSGAKADSVIVATLVGPDIVAKNVSWISRSDGQFAIYLNDFVMVADIQVAWARFS